MTGVVGSPPLVLVAHGSRSRAAADVVERLAAGARGALDAEVRVAYVGVRAPSVADATRGLAEAVVLPAFLAAGYHVRRDLPGQLATAGARSGIVVTPALGPDPLLAAAARARLVEAGWSHGDRVVLAAAGSSDPDALAGVRRAAHQLGELTGAPVPVGYASGAAPRIDTLVEDLRRDGAGRIAIASWLLAPGAFQDRFAVAGADVLAAPLGARPEVVAAIIARYRGAQAVLRRAA